MDYEILVCSGIGAAAVYQEGNTTQKHALLAKTHTELILKHSFSPVSNDRTTCY